MTNHVHCCDEVDYDSVAAEARAKVLERSDYVKYLEQRLDDTKGDRATTEGQIAALRAALEELRDDWARDNPDIKEFEIANARVKALLSDTQQAATDEVARIEKPWREALARALVYVPLDTDLFSTARALLSEDRVR